MRRPPSVPDLIAAGNDAVQHAQAVRKYHARQTRRGSPQREADIRIALERLRTTMVPVRAKIGMVPYVRGEIDKAGLKAVSHAIQSERRKLWKMKKPKRRRS